MKSAYKLSLSVLTFGILIYGCSKKLETSTHNPSLTTTATQERIVLTPAGPMPASYVHYIPKGYTMTTKGGHVVRVNSSTDEVAEDFGEYRPATTNSSRTTKQPTGASTPLSPRNGVINVSNPNYVAWQYWDDTATASTNPINYFSTVWAVPNLPAVVDSQTIFISEGMASNTGTTVIQPVLQFGTSAAGGSYKGWYISNWVSINDSIWGYSDLIPVTPGTYLQGVVQLTGGDPSAATYNYTSLFTGYSNEISYAPGDSLGKTRLTSGLLLGGRSALEVLAAYHYTSGKIMPGIGNLYGYPAQQGRVVMKDITLSLTNGYPSYPLAWVAAKGGYSFLASARAIDSSDQGTGKVYLSYITPRIDGSTTFNMGPQGGTTETFITAVAGSQVTVYLDCPTGTGTLQVVTPGAVFSDGGTSHSVTNGSNYITLTMPSTSSPSLGRIFVNATNTAGATFSCSVY